MTDSPDDEYGELLRRALSAEANSVVPSPDGLEIIRARIERRGLRGLMWWRAGASVAGAVLVAAAVVMVVPQFRHDTERVQSNEVNFTVPTSPEMSATSRPPLRTTVSPPAPARPSLTPPPPVAVSKSATPSPKPSAKPSRTPKPSPSPTCGTVSPGTTVEPEETQKACEEPTETPAPPEPSETGVPSDSPCAADECPQDPQRTPVQTDSSPTSARP
ncbi:hypothetical protein ACFQ08_17030 [Streptosporangium algeriense]|uniref:Uncharacterized protein n=1 Tax=Streptosporangium algeriense TaxID=1682748 RepID=A0ABW3DU60_9ACTN